MISWGRVEQARLARLRGLAVWRDVPRAERVRRMRELGRVGGRRAWTLKTAGERSRKYPEFVQRWSENAWRTRLGYPLLPALPPIMTPAAIRMRELRRLRRRRRAYEDARGLPHVPLLHLPRGSPGLTGPYAIPDA